MTFQAKKYLTVRAIVPIDNTSARIVMTFNGDTGSNYAFRVSDDFGSSTTGTSQSNLPISASTSNSSPLQVDMEIQNKNSEAKTGISHLTHRSATAASTAPSMRETVLKWTGTDQITSITFTNSGSGDYIAGAEIVVLGHD